MKYSVRYMDGDEIGTFSKKENAIKFCRMSSGRFTVGVWEVNPYLYIDTFIGFAKKHLFLEVKNEAS